MESPITISALYDWTTMHCPDVLLWQLKEMNFAFVSLACEKYKARQLYIAYFWFFTFAM